MNVTMISDLYHIMDYSGHYYKTNNKDQLVVAEDEEDAELFTIVDANNRIGAGPKSHFYFASKAEYAEEEEPKTETQINNIIDSYFGVESEESSLVKEIMEAELPEDVEKSISEYDVSKIDWKEYINHFLYVTEHMAEYKTELIKSESEVDQKICDILHYIELCDVDSYEAEDLVELLKVCRENRRDIKDELSRVESFIRNMGTSENVSKAKTALKCIKGLETRQYTPRKLSELFEGSEIRFRSRSERASASERKEDNSDRCHQMTSQEDDMQYTRKPTIFDNKDNDWLAFAAKQAEYYRNVKQYMVNIQLDIDDIDAKIDELMTVIDTTKCNVTQGYKLLKELKDLRLEKKIKEQELESLKILTGNFDVNAMADEYEACTEDIENLLEGEAAVNNGEVDELAG